MNGSSATTTSYTVTGLSTGTEYTIELRAVNASGHGLAATVTVTPNTAPTAVDDTASTSLNTAVDIDVVANDTDPDFGPTLSVTAVTTPGNGAAVIASGGTTVVTYTPDADFIGTDSFDYTLSDGTDTDTGTVTVTVQWVAPTNLVAAPDSGRIVVQWDTGNSGITHYLISSVATGSGQNPTEKLVEAGSGTKTTAEVTSLTDGTQYTFTVQAAEVSGGQTVVTGVAASVNATPTVAVPAMPTGLTATPGVGEIALTWDNPNNITIRRYQYSADGGTTFHHMNDSDRNTTSLTVTGLTNGTEYQLAIRVSNRSGSSAPATITATAGWPAPTNLVARVDSTRIVLRWKTGDPGITHYLISSEITDGSSGAPPDKLVTAGSGTRMIADVTSLTNGTEYTFTVRAAEVSGGQTVVTGAAASVVATPTVAVPAPPTNLTATPGDGQVTVTWDNPHNISIRKYQYSADGGATFHHMNGSGRNTTSFTFTGLTNGEPYTLGIRASNLSGESAPTTVGVNQPPDTTGPRVSNLGKSDDGSTSADRKYHAQAFTTGWDTQGYTLVAIEVDLQRSPGDATLTVQIRDDDGSGNPGSRIFTLTNPSELETGIVRFTAPADTHLEPHTKYWLHLAYGGNTRPRWGKTYSDGEDPGAYSGWSIANDRRHRTSSPGTWTAADSSLRVRVNISNPYGVALVSNLGKSDDGSTSADRKYHAQAFTTGGDTQGYPLAAIEVDLRRSPGDATLTVQIRDDDGSGNPGSRIFTLTNPSELETGIVRFTAPADTHLEADTKYWLHLAYGGNTRPRWGKTYSDGEDPGAYSGWSIANDRRHRTSSPGTWTAADSSIRIRIKTWPANGNN